MLMRSSEYSHFPRIEDSPLMLLEWREDGHAEMFSGKIAGRVNHSVLVFRFHADGGWSLRLYGVDRLIIINSDCEKELEEQGAEEGDFPY